MSLEKKNLPDGDHVIRFVPYRRQHREFGTGALTGILGIAFEPRPQDRGALSVTWWEFFGTANQENFVAAVEAFKESWGKLSANAVFAIGNVGAIKRACKTAGKPVRIVHEPTAKNPGHAAIRRLERAEAVMLDQLAQEAFSDIRNVAGDVACESPLMGYTSAN